MKVRKEDNIKLSKALAGPYRRIDKEASDKEHTQGVETFDDKTKSCSEDQDLQFFGCNIHRCENRNVFITQTGTANLWTTLNTEASLVLCIIQH